MKSWKFDINPNGKELACGCYSLLVFDLDIGEKVTEVSNDGKFFYSLCYISDSKVALGNYNGSINIVSLESNSRVHRVEGKQSRSVILCLYLEHCMAVRTLNMDDNRHYLLSASDDLHITMIDTNTYQAIQSLVGHKDIITGIVVNKEKNFYVSCSFDGSVKIWDVRQAKSCIQTVSLSKEGVSDALWDIALSSNGSHITVASDLGCHLLSMQ